VLDVSLLAGHSWADQARAGSSVVATGTDRTATRTVVTELARRYWDARRAFRYAAPALDFDGCLALAANAERGPVFISDSGDNLSAGAPAGIRARPPGGADSHPPGSDMRRRLPGGCRSGHDAPSARPCRPAERHLLGQQPDQLLARLLAELAQAPRSQPMPRCRSLCLGPVTRWPPPGPMRPSILVSRWTSSPGRSRS